MAGTLQEPTARKGVTFELEDLAVDDGRLVVSGHWFGVRGLRFVRPTLLFGGRQILATLDHKPWAPNGGKGAWVAAFPWDADTADVGEIALAVAPSVTVPLVPGEPQDEDADEGADLDEPPETVVASASASATERLEVEVTQLQAQIAVLRADVTALAGERDRALAARDDAVGARIAIATERDSATTRCDQALATSKQALAARDAAVAERDSAVAERDSAVAERDRARARRAQPPEAEKPIGVRTVAAPHAAGLMTDDSPQPAHTRGLARFDVWAVRLFVLVGAACFVLLLALLVRLYF